MAAEKLWWRVKDLNLRRQSRGIYSPLPLAARATRQGRTSSAAIMDSARGKDTLGGYTHKMRFKSEGALIMAADSSFDVTSKIDRMELDNAINQAVREIETRFDFKNTGSKIELEGDKVLIEADTEERAKAALDVVKDKMIKRGVSLKHLDAGEPQLSGKIYKIAAPLKEGISTENAKKIAKKIRDEGPKSVKTQIQGDELRVTSKSRDDLQETMAMIKDGGWDFAVQFTNFR